MVMFVSAEHYGFFKTIDVFFLILAVKKKNSTESER